MSNNAHLIACDIREAAPTLVLKSRQYEIVAEGAFRVPPLWMTLFRKVDLIDWIYWVDDDNEFPVQTPVISRSRVAKRIEEAKVALTRSKAVKHGCWCDLLNKLKSCVDSLKPRRKFLVCEWQEIAGLDLKRHERDMKWLLEFFSGRPLKNVDQRLSQLCGARLSKQFQNPATTASDEFTEGSWETLDGLLGDTIREDAPWHPTLHRRNTYDSCLDAMAHDDEDALKRMLEHGFAIQPGEVQHAASVYKPEFLWLLLEHNGDPDETYGHYGSPLVRAFNSHGKPAETDAKLRMLLDHGANPNVTGIEPDTILWCCMQHGLKFAEEIVNKTKKTVLRAFLKELKSEQGQPAIQSLRIKQPGRFVRIVEEHLAR